MVLIVFAVALLARAGWGTFRLVRASDPQALAFPDEVQYWSMASSLRSGQGLQDELGFRATRMPLYPALLAPFTGWDHGVIAAKVFHWVIGAGGALLACAAAASLIGPRVGFVAGLLVAVDPFAVFTSSLLLTETLFMLPLLGLWWILAVHLRTPSAAILWRYWLAVGVVAAALVYVRESGLGLIAIVLFLQVLWHRFERRTVFGVALAGSIVVLSLVPWAARNRVVTGEWCWLTHRAGISLYDGVKPEADGSSDLGDIKQMPAVKGLDEAAWNRYFLRQSYRAIREDPGRILRLACLKMKRQWNPFPNVDTHQSTLIRCVSAGWMLPIYALALAGLVLLPRIRRGDAGHVALLLLLPAGYQSLLHCLFVGSVRYRLVAMPMIEVLAAVAIVLALPGAPRGAAGGARGNGSVGPEERNSER